MGTGSSNRKLIKPEENNFLSITLINKISHSKLEEFLIKFDVLFAMGTSALEGARIGMPVICLDYSFKKVDEGYKYKYLYEMSGYCTTERLESHSYHRGNNTMSKILQDLSTFKKINEISSKCYCHYKSNHSLIISASVLEKHLSKVNYKWEDFNRSHYKNSLKFLIYNKLRAM